MRKTLIILILLCVFYNLHAQRFRNSDVCSLYTILDYIATHPKSDCVAKEQELATLIDSPSFDINQSCENKVTPLAYLVRKNYEYLGKFSVNYISDNVLKILIEKGAKVNTYDEIGNTLMTFALETNNEYLSKYFIDRGVNLAKKNESGIDVLNQAISNQNMVFIKQITATEGGKNMLNVDYLNQAIVVGNFEIVKHLHEKGVDINVNTLTVEPSRFIKNTAVYDYITKICADNAVVYADLRKYKSLFPDKFSLIKSKIDKIYYDEAAPVDDTFEMIKQFVKTNVRIENNMSFGTKMSESDLALERRMAYAQQFAQKHNGYDPDNKIKIVNDIVDFNTVMAGLHTQVWRTYLKVINNGSLWDNLFSALAKDYRTYDILNGEAEKHHRQIINAMDIAKKIQNNNTFGNTLWFDEKIDELRKKGEELHDTWEKDKAIYNADLKAANAKREQAIAANKQEQCDNCVVDRGKSKFPENTEDIFGFSKQNPGKIVMKNGDKQEFYYDDRSWYVKDGFIFTTTTRFDTWEKLIEECMKRCKERYCK